MTRRARPGYTYDPCHCCGSTLHQRPKDRICSDCVKLVADAQAIRQAQDSQAASGEAMPFYTHERDYALPYLAHVDRDLGLQAAFLKLSELLSTPTKDRPPMVPDPRVKSPHDYKITEDKWFLWGSNNIRSGDWVCQRTFSPAIAEAIRTLFLKTREAIEQAYKNGHKDGRNLLMQLAGGEITTNQLNETALRREQP